MKSVTIIAGSGPGWGRGHVQRMQILADLLTQDGVAVQFLTSPEQALVEGKLTVLDRRDTDPRPYLAHGPVIALDNRHHAREKISEVVFHDTLPHPNCDLELVFRSALIHPDLQKYGKLDKPTDAFAYSGALTDTEMLDDFLCSLVTEGLVRQAFRCGSSPPGKKRRRMLRHAAKLDRNVYFETLGRSKYVLTYFGMTMLEALHLRRTPVLYPSGNADHDVLTNDLRRRTEIPTTNLQAGDERKFVSLDPARLPQPSGEGFSILKKLVCSFIFSHGKLK